MASIPCTFQGVLFFSDLGIGGGPMPGGPHPDQGLPGQQPGIWPSPGHPSHPIAPGGRPPGIWGGPPLYPDQGLPGAQPRPEHPIVIPPDGLAPGIPSHPIYWPIHPDQGLPGAQPRPEHPIVIPGDDEQSPKFEVKTAWSPQTGWITVIVPSGDATVPTPST